MTHATWDPLVSLEPRRTWLLEASAGTGKTYQLTGLFVRLVAEYDVPVEKILAITFTNAATAELRDKIRARLHRACERLASPLAPGEDDGDPTITYLRTRSDVERQRLRLQLALRGFDQAPVSTIHGFAQRMLQELAFESKQELDLELLTNARLVQEQLVLDALACVYANTGPREVALYKRAGFEGDALRRVAGAMCGAVAHRVEPHIVLEPGVELACASAQATRVEAMLTTMRSESGRAALQALCDDHAHLKGHPSGPDSLRRWIHDVEAWLDDGADATKLTPGAANATALKNLRVAWFKENWGKYAKSSPPPVPTPELHTRPWWPLIEALDGLCVASLEFHAAFVPLAAFATTIRAKFEAELARRRQLTFDDMLAKLAASIAPGTEGAEILAARIRERFDAVFVDEFQDTDVAQWTVIEAAFHGHAHLFLIGDPKQAIYAFRGADVNVYLAAAADVTRESEDGASSVVQTMAENWRSDPPVVHAMNHLWQHASNAFDSGVAGPAPAGSSQTATFDYVAVRPNKKTRIDPAGPGLEVRWIDGRVRGEGEGVPLSAVDVDLTARLAAEEVHAWLAGHRGDLVEARGKHGESLEQRRTPVPSDLAVLVPSHTQARAMRRELARLKIPAVSASKNTVFQSAAATWLGAWLDAMSSGGRDREARTAAITPLVGWTGDELAWSLALAERGSLAFEEAQRCGRQWPPADDAGMPLERDWNAWTDRLRRAAERWPRHGFAGTFDRELAELRTLPRILAMPDGERHATDLRHLFELLQIEERARRLGPGPLGDWLRAQARLDGDGREQRLESDDNAVRIETIHVSKGLEYPVVLLPFAWSGRGAEAKAHQPIVLRAGRTSKVDLHPSKHPRRIEAEAAAHQETQREETRRLYVSLTRARHRTIVWWGPVGKNGQRTDATPLGRLLMREQGEHGYDATPFGDFKADPQAAWSLVQSRLASLKARAEGTIEWTACEPPRRPAALLGPAHRDAHAPRWPVERELPRFSSRWCVTSYSRLAKAAAANDRDERMRPDSSESHVAPTSTTDAFATTGAALTELVKPPLRMHDAPPRLTAGHGTVFGTFVHEVFDELDFASLQTPLAASGPGAPVNDALLERVRALGGRHGFGPTSREVDEVTAMMPHWLTTPLDPQGGASKVAGLPESFCLASLAKKDRLDELAFDLRLGSGTRYRRSSDLEATDRTVLDARIGAVDPRQVYAALRLEPRSPGIEAWLAYQEAREKSGAALIGSIVGILTGSIDLAFRVDDCDVTRYYVADYKTNKIEACAPGHFTGPWLDWKMTSSGYLLQSLLYTLALHRHLRLRLPDASYSYEENFGGVLYLFLRGMAGPKTPRCSASGHALGVHGHRWSAEVIHAMDAALEASVPGRLTADGASSSLTKDAPR